MKSSFIIEAEIINSGTALIIRDKAYDQRERTQTLYLVKIEARQKCKPREKVCGRPPSQEEHKKEVVKSFLWMSSSRSLSSFRPILWFLFPHLTYPGTLPLVRIHPSAKVDLKVKDSGGRKFIMVWHYSLTFDPEGGFLHKCQFSSVQFSFSVVSNSLRPHESQHTRPPCPSPTPGVHSDSCPSSP